MMPITVDPADRAEGLIYLDPGLANQPATHVLLVGVGRFDDPKNPAIAKLAALTSPPASARAMAGWFLDGTRGKPGFRNPDRPLGSLSLLLSEADKAASYEGGAVPEATFAKVKAAVEGWVTRAMTNADNASILLIASHGQAFNRQTAILFQDYGCAPLDPYAGMTEVEQLADALSTVPPVDKLLLIDCCRLPTELNLVAGRTYGSALIGGQPLPPGGMGDPPQVLRSTRLGAAAYGAGDGRPTLFTGAVLDALSGAAASPNDDWQVAVTDLSKTAGKILSIWREDGEPLQSPSTQHDRDMVVCHASESQSVSMFLVLPDGQDIASSMARVSPVGVPPGPNPPSIGPVNGEPFIRLSVPELSPSTVAAFDAAGGLIGEIEVRVRAPWLKQVLPALGTAPTRGIVVSRAKSADTDAAGGFLTVSTQEVMGVPQAPVIRVAPMTIAPPLPAAEPIEDPFGPVPGGDRVRVTPPRSFDLRRLKADIARPTRTPARIQTPLAPIVPPKGGGPLRLARGQWVIRASRPGMTDVETVVDVEDGDEVTLDLPSFRSGHEWLAPAVMAGVIRPRERGEEFSSTPPAPDIKLQAFDLSPVTNVAMNQPHSDGRFAVFRFDDTVGERFAMGQDGPLHSPVWADVRGKSWRERCFVPVQGAVASWGFQQANGMPDNWRAEVLVDDAPPSDRSHVAGYAVNGRWGALLAFLARRSFLDAGAALQTIAADIPLRDAVMGKVANPLAALAAAQIAVATNQTEALNIPEDWLDNLSNWFPTLPDGPAILGRHRQRRGQKCADQFAKAHQRGVPVFSLTLDWLAAGLAATDHPAAAEARSRAQRTDPTRAFTVMRLADEDP